MAENLTIGDSITVMFGDTIQFRYNQLRTGFETGALLVTRNTYNKIEYYESGEWKDYYLGKFLSVQSYFDLERRTYESKIWNPGPEGPLLAYESSARFQDDSLIDHSREYYPNGQLKVNSYNLVRKGFNPKHKHWVKFTKIGTWTYYTENGQVKRTKVYSK